MYLQFEENKLCFKIQYEGDKNRSEIRWKYFKLLMAEANSSYPEIQKPIRFGAGIYMTIGIVNSDDLFGQDKINMKSIIDKLRNYEQIIDRCMLKA